MEKITSFTVNHLKLLTGVYVSRKDYLKGDVLTTFDLRFTRPNYEEVMDTASIHALEHLGATFLRNDEQWGKKIIYFGPMGCRTGFYLIIVGDLESLDIIPLLQRMINFILQYEGDIPGAKEIECGNFRDSDLNGAKRYAQKFLNEVLINPSYNRLNYPL
ncbi:MAG TPA: S-ribosylhomocysteine lyase [Haloplasmataceae bacterium]